jgi:fumarylacetoacetase
MTPPPSAWVPGADGSGFGIENLPYGVVRGRTTVRIGDYALPLADALGDDVFARPALNDFIAQGRSFWAETRRRLVELLSGESHRERIEPMLIPLDGTEPELPLVVGDYVDFYSSIEHATHVGKLLRPDDPLFPNWRHLPVGYHGRAGTVVVSGAPVTRPSGQRAPEEEGGSPSFGPERALDFELELAFVTGDGGPRISTADAADHIFGFVLLNDWSAREIQRWEYQPLGPFLSKSFATQVAPWIVPFDAIQPLRTTGPPQDPPPLDHLRTDEPWALDIDLEVAVNDNVVTRVNARGLYWNAAQQLAHATSNGATIRAGDLFASGTISGSEPGTYGCMLENMGPFLEDGDTVAMTGRGGPISFGEVRGKVEGSDPSSRGTLTPTDR